MLVLVVALLAGLVTGALLGGRVANLQHLPLRFAWLVLAAFAVQLFAFSSLGATLGNGTVIGLHVASYVSLLVFAVTNLACRGMPIVLAGIAANALAIFANGGYMPATRSALIRAGLLYTGDTVNNSELIGPDTKLRFLCDVFAVPSHLPLATVFSVGDILIGVGVACLVAFAMRGPHTATAETA